MKEKSSNATPILTNHDTPTPPSPAPPNINLAQPNNETSNQTKHQQNNLRLKETIKNKNKQQSEEIRVKETWY